MEKKRICKNCGSVDFMSSEQAYFFFDEADEIGFLNSEFTPCQIGLIAGFAFPVRNYSKIENDLKNIFTVLDLSGVSKRHATEVFANPKNHPIREKFFNYILSQPEFLIAYEAVYPQGVFKFHENMPKPKPKSKPSIKLSGNEKKERLYNTLLEGLLIKLDEICRLEDATDLMMISDHIDKVLKSEANKLLNYHKHTSHVDTITGCDTQNKHVVRGQVTTRVVTFDNVIKHILSIKFEEGNPSDMTFAADTICNSLRHYLLSKISKDNLPRLHSNIVVKDFKLVDKIVFLDDNYFPDTQYRPFNDKTQGIWRR
jgi:hypothetical protein